MLGAIIGDIVGSPYEFGSHKRKDFPLFQPQCRPTDDSVLTVAVGCACVQADLQDEGDFKTVLADYMRRIGMLYLNAGYGERFYRWMIMEERDPYGGNTNGSAMRVSPVAWAADSLEMAQRLAKWSAEITHDHPEGIRGAQAVASAVYLARTGADQAQIRDYIVQNYYDLDFTLDEIRPTYCHDMSCQGSVPQAIMCFLEAESFEDAVRNAISLGGDGDTQAAMAGAIAEAYFGIPEELQEQAMEYMDETLLDYFDQYAQELY